MTIRIEKSQRAEGHLYTIYFGHINAGEFRDFRVIEDLFDDWGRRQSRDLDERPEYIRLSEKEIKSLEKIRTQPVSPIEEM
jgi:hypothetical protein